MMMMLPESRDQLQLPTASFCDSHFHTLLPLFIPRFRISRFYLTVCVYYLSESHWLSM